MVVISEVEVPPDLLQPVICVTPSLRGHRSSANQLRPSTEHAAVRCCMLVGNRYSSTGQPNLRPMTDTAEMGASIRARRQSLDARHCYRNSARLSVRPSVTLVIHA